MYTLRQVGSPALGKESEIRSQLTEWGQQLQGKGRNVAVTQRLFSSDGPVFVMATRAEDLNALENMRHENLTDSDWQARAAKAIALLRGPVQSFLAETLIEISGDGPVGVVQRAFGFPALGQEQQFRSITEDFVKASRTAGVRMGLGQRVFSSMGPVFEVTSLFADLAALDRSRQARAGTTRDVVQSLHELSRAPIQVRLLEVLVPFRT